MPAYILVNIDIHDPEMMKRYSAAAQEVVWRHGGKYLARGGEGTPAERQLPHKRVTILEFPSMEAAQGFWYSPEYQEVAKVRQAAAEAVVTFVPGYTEPR